MNISVDKQKYIVENLGTEFEKVWTTTEGISFIVGVERSGYHYCRQIDIRELVDVIENDRFDVWFAELRKHILLKFEMLNQKS